MKKPIEFYLNEKKLDLLMDLVGLIESSHQIDIKMLELINNDTYNHMNASGLFDYSYVQRGHSASKGVLNKPSQMNLVFYFYLSVLVDLKAFGFNKPKLHKIKDYLFEQIALDDYLDVDGLKGLVNSMEFENAQIKTDLLERLESGLFLKDIKDKKVSRLFLQIFKLIWLTHDIQLMVDVNADAFFIDDFELSDGEMNDLSKDSRIIIPLKQYLVKFVGSYFKHDFVSRAKILSERDILILEQLKQNDIDSITVKFHKGAPNIMEVKKQKKVQIQSRLSEVLLKGGFEDIVLKSKQGAIYYSQLTTKTKL